MIARIRFDVLRILRCGFFVFLARRFGFILLWSSSVLLAADLLGNIRTQTMRAFTTSEMEKILAKVP